MYFLKFLAWFWTKHLKKTEDRVIVGTLMWGVVFLAIFTYTVATGVYPIILLIYLSCTALVLCFWALYTFIKYMSGLYNQWQSEVFNKLRE